MSEQENIQIYKISEQLKQQIMNCLVNSSSGLTYGAVNNLMHQLENLEPIKPQNKTTPTKK